MIRSVARRFNALSIFISAVFTVVFSMVISVAAFAHAAGTATAPAKAVVAPAPVCTGDTAKSAYDFAVVDVEGKPAKLADYKGKVALIVNTASKCGYTGQYRDLQALYAKYKDKGFVVLGFPSNDFGGQEPGTNKEIKTFCETNFNVKFPLFDKGPVIGSAKQPLYKFLTEEAGETYKGEIGWNFEKFLVDKKGRVVGRYKSDVKPSDVALTKVLESNLAKDAAACL
jgi:glutathione peroxidase